MIGCDHLFMIILFWFYLQAIEPLIPQLDDLLSDPSTVQATLQVLLKLAEQSPDLVLDHFPIISNVAKTNPTMVAIAAQILSTAGKVNKV